MFNEIKHEWRWWRTFHILSVEINISVLRKHEFWLFSSSNHSKPESLQPSRATLFSLKPDCVSSHSFDFHSSCATIAILFCIFGFYIFLVAISASDVLLFETEPWSLLWKRLRMSSIFLFPMFPPTLNLNVKVLRKLASEPEESTKELQTFLEVGTTCDFCFLSLITSPWGYLDCMFWWPFDVHALANS